jgi:hypothetical protein
MTVILITSLFTLAVTGNTLGAWEDLTPLDDPTGYDGATGWDDATDGWQKLFDGATGTEYKNTSGDWTWNHIDFNFGEIVSVAGLYHMQRSSYETQATTSFLWFSNSSNFSTYTQVDITHETRGTPNISVGPMTFPYPETKVEFDPVSAQYVRWKVTGRFSTSSSSQGGAELAFMTPEPATALLLAFGGLALLRRRS